MANKVCLIWERKFEWMYMIVDMSDRPSVRTEKVLVVVFSFITERAGTEKKI